MSARAHRVLPAVVLALSCAGSNRTSGADAGAVSGEAESGTGDSGLVDATDASPPALPPSCAQGGPGLTTCGANSESCCTTLAVAGGTYYRGYETSADGGSIAAFPATVSGFKLDKYEVTVGRFRRFVLAWNGGVGWLPPMGSGKHGFLNGGNGLSAAGGGYETGWDPSGDADIEPTATNLACDMYSTWTASPAMNEDRPINCVNWYEAYAFCVWDGGFLPSEAEWGYAAAGGDQQREYPWGSTDPGTTNLYEIYGCHYPNGSRSCSSAGNVAPVGSTVQGAGRWGQLDLAGNVGEWNLDWYFAVYAAPCTDCAYLTGAVGHSIRGGSFFEYVTASVTGYREANPPKGRNAFYGIRCARGE